MCWLFIYSKRYGLRTVPLKQHIINTIQPLARYGSETVPPVNVFLLNAEYFPDAVVHALVVGVLALKLLCGPYHADGDGQNNDLVESLEHHLRHDEYGQLFHGHHATESQGEEDERVGNLAVNCRQDGTVREVLAIRLNLHSTHYISVDKRANEES